MSPPARFPESDAQEQRSVGVLLHKLHSDVVKADIKARDKYPNVDGAVEIVDEDGFPVAKLEVQLKSIPHRQTHFDCPKELVEYSDISTLPILLLCVDVEANHIYWKHISSSMPQYVQDQKTSRIRFREETDLIDDRGLYISRWIDIAREYQQKLATFEDLELVVTEQLDVASVPPRDRELFQDFIDAVNSMLDGDFRGLKPTLFPGTWKLGVSVFQSTPERFGYQLYRIQKGHPAPLVVGRLSGSLIKGDASPNVFLESILSRSDLQDPVERGQQFVLDSIKEVVEQRALSLYGPLVSADTLVAFVDEYHSLLGLRPGKEKYSLADLEFAMRNRLIDNCSRIIWSHVGKPWLKAPLDLDHILLILGHDDFSKFKEPDQPIRFSITANNVPIRSAFTALEYFKSIDVDDVERVFPIPDYSDFSGGAWIWQGFSRDQEVEAITTILSAATDEYEAFVSGNRLSFPQSPYLDENTAILYEYEPLDDPKDSRGPTLHEVHVANLERRLPKCNVTVRGSKQEKPYIDASEFPKVRYNSSEFDALRASHGTADFFFHSCPVMRMLYRMLIDDLERHFDIGPIYPST